MPQRKYCICHIFSPFCNTLLTYTPPYRVSHILNRDVIFLNGKCGHRVVTRDGNNDKHSSCQCRLVVPYTPLSHVKCQIDKPDPLAQFFFFFRSTCCWWLTLLPIISSIRASESQTYCPSFTMKFLQKLWTFTTLCQNSEYERQKCPKLELDPKFPYFKRFN